jgi:hypothetical protein
MRFLSVQVQPARSPGLDIARLRSAFESLASDARLVESHRFASGDDDGTYFNFTFETPDPQSLWAEIRERFYGNGEFGFHMARASMATCSHDATWHDCDLLFHFDPKVPRDDGPAA